MAKDIVTLYQQRLKTQERGGGGVPNQLCLVCFCCLYCGLFWHQKSRKKLVRLVWALEHNNYKTVKGLNPGVISKVG